MPKHIVKNLEQQQFGPSSVSPAPLEFLSFEVLPISRFSKTAYAIIGLSPMQIPQSWDDLWTASISARPQHFVKLVPFFCAIKIDDYTHYMQDPQLLTTQQLAVFYNHFPEYYCEHCDQCKPSLASIDDAVAPIETIADLEH